MTLSHLHTMLAEARYETARRTALALLARPGGPDRAAIVLALHDALVALGDFREARTLLTREADTLRDEPFAVALRMAVSYRTLAQEGHFRNSQEAREGFTVDEYISKYTRLADEAYDTATALALRDADREALRQARVPPVTPFVSLVSLPERPLPPGRGRLRGRILLPDGTPAAGAVVTLGLKTEVEQPDLSRFVIHAMHSNPRIGPLRKETVTTDAGGCFEFPEAPAQTHDFLAVTLDPACWEVPTRFLARSIAVAPGELTDLGTLTVTEWRSAPPRPFPSPHPASFSENGVVWHKEREWKLRNPFHYDFPRQLLTLSHEGETGRMRLRIEPGRDVPFQPTGEGLALLIGLAAQADRVIALYVAETAGTAEEAGGAFSIPAPAAPLRIGVDAAGNREIDTGVAACRLAGAGSVTDAPPLQAVRGPDGVWRGEGRFLLPPGITIRHREHEVLEEGPLLITVRNRYTLSNGARWALTVTALTGEPLLLVRETSDALEGASFEFSLREFTGGRGYLHWTPENGSPHWSTLTAEERTIGQLPESVPWWIPPQGFGYAMSADGLDGEDYIGVFSRRRGEWVDRAFEKIAQGPIDEDGRENRELEWPHPEMVGSSISMITVHTSAAADAFYRFGFFDGERQWGMLISSFARNDGPWKEFGRLQHAYSSPRLQEFKDWHFDVPDPFARPHVVAQRGDLPRLRRKGGGFAGLREKIRREPGLPGPRDGVLFAIDGDPLVAWRMRILLNYVAENRARMTLLGRDWSDMYSPVGGRNITKWAEEYDLIAPSGVFTEEEERRIRDFFSLMGHLYLEEDFMNWRFNGRNANFEADRVDIIGAVGLVFQGHPDAAKFIDHVVERTHRSLLAYCTPGSGRWYENPACYYLHASKCRVNLIFHLARKGLLELDSIPRLRDFLRWGIHLLTPAHPVTYGVMRDGGEEAFRADLKVRKVPPIGDHAGIGKWLPEHYATMGKLFMAVDPAFGAELLNAYFVSNADGQRLLGLGSWEGNTPESAPDGVVTGSVAGNLPLLFCTLEEDDLPGNPQLALPGRRLEGFGAVFRNRVNTPEEDYLLIKQGPGGYRYHRTEGSFLLFSGGRPLVFDGGEAGETWRHSTLSFHEVQMPLSPARVERHFDAAGFQFIAGAHPVILEPGQPVFLNDHCRHELVEECYRRFRLEPPAAVRSFAWVDGDYLIIHDDLSASRPELSHWHLQVVGSTPQSPGAGDYRFPGRFGLDLRVLLPGQRFDARSCETLPIHHYSGAPETWFAMEHLQLTRRHASHYLAGLKPVPSGRECRFVMTALHEGEAIIGARVEQDQASDLLWFRRAGLRWAEGETEFEGSFGGVLRRPGRLRLLLMGAGRLRAGDFVMTSTGPCAVLEIGADGPWLQASGAGGISVENGARHHHFTVEEGPVLSRRI